MYKIENKNIAWAEMTNNLGIRLCFIFYFKRFNISLIYRSYGNLYMNIKYIKAHPAVLDDLLFISC